MATARIPPFAILLFLLLSVPLLEIYLLISVGRVIGAGWTVIVVVLTAVLGAWLLRLQGLQTLARVQTATKNGELPAVELVEGLILLVCGALLLTPGFFTDAMGFVALIPRVRRTVAQSLLERFLHRSDIQFHSRSRTHGERPDVIEGVYRRED